MGTVRRLRFAWRLLAAVASLALVTLGVLALPATSQAAGSLPCDIYGADGTSVRGGVQHGPGAVLRLRRAAVPGASAPRTARRPTSACCRPAATSTRRSRTPSASAPPAPITEIYDQSPGGEQPDRRGGGRQRRGGQPGASPTRCRSRSTATRRTAWTSLGAPATGTTAPRGSRSTARPRACTWWPAAPMSTPAAASTSATPRPTTTTTAPGTWTPSTSPRTAAPSAPCTGNGPWVEADMENGQYVSGDGSNPADTGNNNDFVTAMLAEQWAEHLRARGRQRAIRRPDHLLGRVPAQRLRADAPRGRDRARHRRRQQPAPISARSSRA